MKLRRADGRDAEDAAKIIRLHLAIFPEDIPMTTEEGAWWLVEDESKAVAFAGVTPSKRILNVGYLCRAGVLSTYRGNGLQRRLIRVRERYAREQGWSHLVTDTTIANTSSANNLIACGYKLHLPKAPWCVEPVNYWIKEL